MIDNQYGITIMGGREVSRPYRVFRRRRVVFILLAMPPPSLERAALVMWCGYDSSPNHKPKEPSLWFVVLCGLIEIRHATALTAGAKHWHRRKAVFYVFVSVPPAFIH